MHAGAQLVERGGASLRMLASMLWMPSPSNGRRPVIISNSTTPSDQTSARGPTRRAPDLLGRHVGGASHRLGGPGESRRRCSSLATPKSRIFTSPSGRTITFAGLTSRWTMPLSCASASPSAICAAIASARAGSIGPRSSAVAQRLAFAVREREKETAVGRLADVVERADVRMIQRRRGPRLRFEATPGEGVAGEMRRQHLERDRTAQPHVLGAVDHTHAAFADLADDAVVGQLLADVHRFLERGGRTVYRRARA